MITTQEEGIYSKTQAFNLLKELLGVPKNVLINKHFFNLFFDEIEDRKFQIKNTETFIKELFTKKGIVEMNRLYYQEKMKKRTEMANACFKQTINLVREGMIKNY